MQQKNNLKYYLSLFILITLVSCGENQSNKKIVSSNIFGGKSIEENLSLKKHIVGVSRYKTQGICTGTIISDQVILTAAHCVPENTDANEIKIIFDHDFQTQKENKINAESIIIHEDYVLNEKIIANDIALIKLEKSIPDNYSPLNLNDISSLIFSEIKKSTVSGFGYSRVEFPRLGLGNLRFTEIEALELNENSPLIYFDQSKGRGVCQGDSGGGAFVIQNDQWIQIGVTSFVNTKENNPKKADCKKISAFSSIHYFLPWILENILKL